MRTISYILLNKQSFLVRRVLSAWWYRKYGNNHSIFPKFSEEDMRSFLKEMGAEVIPNDFNLLWEECVKIAEKGLR